LLAALDRDHTVESEEVEARILAGAMFLAEAAYDLRQIRRALTQKA
jgi:hypothetical protein